MLNLCLEEQQKLQPLEWTDVRFTEQFTYSLIPLSSP